MMEQQAAQCFFTEGGGGSFHSQCMDQGPEYWHTTAARVTGSVASHKIYTGLAPARKTFVKNSLFGMATSGPVV